jgi:hypothetical protein
MTIVCLGWGSLLWDPRELPVSSPWRYDGPEVPIEFARQSGDGRITLVITPGAKPVRVFTAELVAPSIERACSLLAERENIPSKFIDRSVGHLCATSRSDHAETEAIARWIENTPYDGVVWTALKPKFGNVFILPSCEQVTRYLGDLHGETRRISENYVRNTPREIATGYRQEIEKLLGWTPVNAA